MLSEFIDVVGEGQILEIGERAQKRWEVAQKLWEVDNALEGYIRMVLKEFSPP